eukprot:CAMPEP_0113575076 /NCGR_PEP_ID=MMETSP0015_2-20120614/27487_1 /TAXON_ID=2838 /ORGANISM="Odontella" /LENGTH=538 /DNA_ID=CAMNT_0000478255 /DNA_START=58 /DNA_END=1674 /DNA_ORIENTATION=- /assembly_acc=CAM_ASM_000160
MKFASSQLAFLLAASSAGVGGAFTHPSFISSKSASIGRFRDGANAGFGSFSDRVVVPLSPAFGGDATRKSRDEISSSSPTSLDMGLRTFFMRGSHTPTEEEVRSLFHLWNDALATGDSSVVAERYSRTPILLPTVSDTPRTDFDSIKDYFDAFLKKKPQGKIVEGKITLGQNWAMDAGVYEFTMGADGSKVKARYSFVYAFEDGYWRIAHHHSSVMPEGTANAAHPPMSELQVKDLFHLWNDALATLDSSKVAARYSKEGVLLPTVSDVPRTDSSSIEDYFDAFLKKKPQGTVLESNVIVGTNWCQDAGIYEFTMGADGSKVKARYTFIYVHEDNEWKIAHHHSSVMPESILPSPMEKGDVRRLFDRWNGALATLDSSEVASCYARNAVLLPTVSDTPRTNPYLIRDYFESFLKKKPRGEILYGDVVVGTNWAQDAGTYEFTMGVDGSKVRGRYTFVYVMEDGEWKISHHHSSVMPEGLLAAGPYDPSSSSEVVSPAAAPVMEDEKKTAEIKVNGTTSKVEIAVKEDADELAELVGLN